MQGSARPVSFALALALCASCDPLAADRLKGDAAAVESLNCPSALLAARKSGQPAPLLVLLETDPWAMVIGSDSPAFALYEDGRAIYRTKSGYRSVRLDRAQLDRFLKSLDLESLARIAGGYTATQWTDQPQTWLLAYAGESPAFIWVYGSLEQKDVRAKLPPEILEVRDELRAFQGADASEWLPEDVEVMIWPYDYAPEPSIVWPKRWPGIDAPTTRRRGESFSLFVPSAEIESLRAFLAGRNEKGAVEIGGKKWAASLRLPFPHEQLWMPSKAC